jgi:hypothetical protein
VYTCHACLPKARLGWLMCECLCVCVCVRAIWSPWLPWLTRVSGYQSSVWCCALQFASTLALWMLPSVALGCRGIWPVCRVRRLIIAVDALQGLATLLCSVRFWEKDRLWLDAFCAGRRLLRCATTGRDFARRGYAWSPTRLSVYPSVCSSVRLSVCLSVCLCLAPCPPGLHWASLSTRPVWRSKPRS